MQIGSAGSLNSAGVANKAQVQVYNKARDQQEAVVGKILDGVEQTSRVIESYKGQNLNVAA